MKMGRQIAIFLSEQKEKEFMDFILSNNHIMLIRPWSKRKSLDLLKNLPLKGPYNWTFYIWHRKFKFKPEFIEVKKEHQKKGYLYAFHDSGKPVIEFSRSKNVDLNKITNWNDGIIGDIYAPQDLNKYAYVRNNPYKYVDESGDIPVPVAVGIGAGLLVGGATSLITYQQTGDLTKSLTAGSISGVATGLSITTLGMASTTAVAGGTGLRYMGTTGASRLATGSALASIGGVESIARQTLIQGRSANELSFFDVGTSAGANTLGRPLSRLKLPGTFSRTAGTFYPSTFGSAFLRETGSQTSLSLYSSFATQGTKFLYNQLNQNPSQNIGRLLTSPSGGGSYGGSGGYYRDEYGGGYCGYPRGGSRSGRSPNKRNPFKDLFPSNPFPFFIFKSLGGDNLK